MPATGESVTSYLSVQTNVAGKSKMYAGKYAQFVIDYAVEWEKVVVARVSAGLIKAEQLRVELDHYQRKVESLRQSANATMAKGKQVDGKSAERLTRNEDKLIKNKADHTKFVSDLCLLIEEVTERSWRDLHPLLVKIAQFDVTISGDEAKAMTSLNTVVNELKRLAVTHGIKPQARLKDLDSLDPTVLSTKAPGSNTLTIEAGLGGLNFDSGGGALPQMASSSYAGSDDQRLPPGSMAPQGMGGYPVALQNADNLSTGYPLNREPSMDGRSYDGSMRSGSTSGAPSTLDMMAITASAAPPPTVDQLSAAFGPMPTSNASIQSAPNTGGYAGAPTSFGMRGRNRSIDSFDSNFSGTSGASAPPPAAPPPPPPPSVFGAPAAAAPNPFGPPPPAPAPYGAPNAYGLPPAAYGAPSAYGTGAPPAPSSYGAPPPYSMYGNTNAAPAPADQFAAGNYSQQPAYGQPPPYGQPPSYGQAPPYGQPPPHGQAPPYGQAPPRNSNPFAN